MHVKPGDKVRFLDEAGEGVVLRIEGKQVWVELDGFEYPFAVEKLIVADGNQTRFATQDQLPLSEEEVREAAKKWSPNLNRARAHCFTQRNAKGVPEIDLHAHELLDDEYGLTPGELKALQLEYVRYALELAREKKVREFVVIHGIGQGALKREVHHLLDGFQDVEHWDAPFRFYGYGGTQVRVRQSQ